MYNDGNPIMHYTIDKTLSVISEIDILYEKHQDHLMQLLHLKQQLIDVIKKKTEEEKNH